VGSSVYLPPLASVLVNAVCIYGCFTVLHDAVHGSVAKSRWLNDLCGVLASLPFCLSGAGFRSFKYVHLLHHKHTNDAEKDPDHWTGSSDSAVILPLLWSTLDFGYISYIWNHWDRVPAGILREVAVTVTLVTTMLVLVVHPYGLWAPFVWHWVVPLRLAIAFLGFAFDWLPHYPFDSTDRWQNTTFIRLPLLQPLLSVVLFYQDFHTIHHLWPQVPFYRYGVAYQLKEEKLREHRCRERDLFSLSYRNLTPS